MAASFTAYIDESGDEGFIFLPGEKGSSRWLVLSAVVFRKSMDLEAVRVMRARPCLSLYMRTHCSHPDNQQDPIRFRHLVGALPRSSSDTSSDRQQTAHSSVSSYGGLGAGHSAMHHGQGGKKDGMDSEVERFFRAVDRAVQAHHSDVSGLPLMLAALPEHHHLFQAISHNPRLMKQGLLINPESLSPTELQQRAWSPDASMAQRAASTIPNSATPGSTMCWTTWARWLRNWAAKCMFWRPNACPQPRALRRVIATEATKPPPCHSWMAFPIRSWASSNSGACAS